MKRSVVILLTLSMLLSMILTGCSAASTTAPQESSSAPTSSVAASETTAVEEGSAPGLTPLGTFPISKEKITLRFFIPQTAEIIDFNTNEYTKWIEDKTNIHLVFDLAPSDAITEKVNLQISAGDLPDVFIACKSALDGEKYGVQEKVLIPLNDLIEAQMPEFKKVCALKDGMLGVATATDGNIYGLVGMDECFHCAYKQKMWINTYWIDKMGVKAPTTTEEFYQVLKAYKALNPNGIPLTGTEKGWAANVDSFIMNAFILDTTGTGEKTRYFLKDGKIDSMVNKPEYKEGLAYLNKLYKEGLLYEGSFTQDADQEKQLVASEGEPVLCVTEGANCDFIDVAATPELYRHYVTLAPLEGPNGVRQSTHFKYSDYQQMSFAITTACKYPEAAARWADAQYMMEVQETKEMAVKGTGWDDPKPGAVGLNGQPALYTRLLAYSAEPQNVNWINSGIYYQPAEWRLGEAMDPNIDKFSAAGLEKLLYDESKEKYEPYASKSAEVVPPLKMLTEESQELQTIYVELTKYIDESRTRFIMGDLSLDTDWDQYVKSLDDIGLVKYLELKQKAYDRQYKK